MDKILIEVLAPVWSNTITLPNDIDSSAITKICEEAKEKLNA